MRTADGFLVLTSLSFASVYMLSLRIGFIKGAQRAHQGIMHLKIGKGLLPEKGNFLSLKKPQDRRFQ
jgi:hypothetical protein